MPELCSSLLWALAEPLDGQVLMVLSMDNNCSATSFDMELSAEKLKSLGVEVSSSCVISPGDPVGVNARWISIICICTHITDSSWVVFGLRGLFQFNFSLFPMDCKLTVMILA